MSNKLSRNSVTKHLTVCGLCLALAVVTSYIVLYKMPWGGSVTLCSMLCITLVGYFYGFRVGILTAFAYSLFQFLQDPYILSPFQVGCDYIFTFTALGVSGCFRKIPKYGIYIGYLVAILARGAFHSLGGYLYWMEYMPDSFPKSLTLFYPLIYNYSYILAEGILSMILLVILVKTKVILQLKKIVE